MILKLKHLFVVALIIAVVISAGCIVPTKDAKPTPSPTSGVNYFVPGSGGSGSNQDNTAGTAGSDSSQGVTPTATSVVLPQDTRYLTPVNPLSTLNSNTLDYRNHTIPEPTAATIRYSEIYNNTLPLNDYAVGYQYDLTSPPLIINYAVTPKMITRSIWYESKTGSVDSSTQSRGDVIEQSTQPDPNAWFEVTVRNVDTNKVVLDEGFGKTLGGDLAKNVTVQSSGKYQIDMQGNAVTVTVKMYIRNST
ncbi:MAG TPA: hypothetical protein VMS89_02560 [Methanoregulaceae archaeon]|nr:hypothetical protein [Methanoregulaceae archaeon]